MTPGPFLPDWNFQVLKELFLRFPHGGTLDAIAQFFTFNALASTWLYAAVFYIYWRIEDNRTIWRRTRLFEIFIAFCLATLATLLLRPWVGWPAPTLVPRFQQLYPKSLWNSGKWEQFSEPFHADLPHRRGRFLVVQTMAELLIDRVGIPADLHPTHLCRRTLPCRHHCSNSFGGSRGVGGAPNLRAAASDRAADADRITGASG